MNPAAKVLVSDPSLNATQMQRLRNEIGVYSIDSRGIGVAALNPGNLDAVATEIAKVMSGDGAVQPTSIWPPSWVFLPYCNAPSGGTIETTDVHLLRCTKCGLDLNGDDPCFTNSTRPSAR